MSTVQEYAVYSAANTCSTAGLKGLNEQILELLLPAVGDKLVSCADLVTPVGNSTIPYLQPAARDALAGAVAAHGSDLLLVHAYRTLAHQYVLRVWLNLGKCVEVVARVGHSPHEKGIAIDIDGDIVEDWQETLEQFNWKPVEGDWGHFTYDGPGIDTSIVTEGILAFQRLWNMNNPGDPLVKDGVWGPNTKQRLKKSPVDGW